MACSPTLSYASAWRRPAASGSNASFPGRPSPVRRPSCTPASDGNSLRLGVGYHLEQRLLDRVDRSVAVHTVQDALAGVAIDDRQRIVQVYRHAIGDDLALVVGPLVELAAADVAGVGDGGRVELGVVAGLAAAAQPAAGQTVHQRFRWHVNVDGRTHPA